MVVFTGCNKESDLCKDIPSIDGEVTYNGNKEKLSFARLTRDLASNNYSFQIESIASDCNELHNITFTILIPENNELTGTYQFRKSSNVYEYDAFGTFTTKELDPISQKSVDIESGTLKLVDMGGDNYSFDIDVTLSNSEKVTMVLTFDFVF